MHREDRWHAVETGGGQPMLPLAAAFALGILLASRTGLAPRAATLATLALLAAALLAWLTRRD